MNKIFNKIILVILIFCLISCKGLENKNFLWKVDSKTSTVFLLGSVHMADSSFYPLNDIIENSFAKSSVLAVEVDTYNANMSSIISKIYYNDGTTLKDHLNPKVYSILENKWKEYNIPIEMDKLKPFFVLLIISTYTYKEENYSIDYGIDVHFLNRAKANKSKEIVELESIDYQLTLFDNFSDSVMNNILLASLEESEKENEIIDTLFSAWKKGDAEAVNNIVYSIFESPETKIFYERLLKYRNENMYKKIESFLETDKVYFVVIGAAHLVGKDGLVELLKKTGKYKIEQL
jgi:hypothetical protein